MWFKESLLYHVSCGVLTCDITGKGVIYSQLLKPPTLILRWSLSPIHIIYIFIYTYLFFLVCSFCSNSFLSSVVYLSLMSSSIPHMFSDQTYKYLIVKTCQRASSTSAMGGFESSSCCFIFSPELQSIVILFISTFFSQILFTCIP